MDGTKIHSKAIVIATGASYTKLEIEGIENFTGAGVYYGAAAVEAHACRNETIYLVGGGNSACQAALYMSKFAKEVNIIIRRESLSQVAANYLVENISHTPNIKVITNTDVISCSGSSILVNSTLQSGIVGEEQTLHAKHLFIHI